MFLYRLLPCALVICTLIGCSSEASRGQSDKNESAASTKDTANFTESGTDVATSGQAAFFSVDGTLSILNGDVEAANSLINIGLWNANAEQLCASTTSSDTSVSNVLGGTTLPTEDPALPLWSLWSLSLQLDLCDTAPRTFDLGIGVYDPLLNPAVDSMGLSGENVYGLYLSMPNDDETYVFGLAGTSDQFSGAVPPATEGPLPDGVYLLDGIYLIPVPNP
ncbi:MAG: hypothetical protein GWP91_04050 [Rhodobacterales bacterium]|nr:hypothetical protein [Rhodobacterales bacterium]